MEQIHIVYSVACFSQVPPLLLPLRWQSLPSLPLKSKASMDAHGVAFLRGSQQLWAHGEVEQSMEDIKQEIELFGEPMEQAKVEQPMLFGRPMEQAEVEQHMEDMQRKIDAQPMEQPEVDQPMEQPEEQLGSPVPDINDSDEDLGDRNVHRQLNRPTAEMAMVVGKFRVPIHFVSLPDETGNFVQHRMVQFTQRGSNGTAQWLWPLFGFSAKSLAAKSHHARDPWKLPLMIEITKAVQDARKKRTRGGGHTDASGRVLPQLMDVCVRGQSLLVENNVKRLSMNLGDLREVHGTCTGEPELLNWFLKQCWDDRRRVKAEVPPIIDQTSSIRSSSSWEIMDASQKHIVQTALDKVLATRLVKYAHFYPVSARFRILAKGDKSKPKWFGVRRFRKLLEENDNDGMESALTIGAVSIVRYLEEDYDAPGAVPGPGFQSLDSANGELIHD